MSLVKVIVCDFSVKVCGVVVNVMMVLFEGLVS